MLKQEVVDAVRNRRFHIWAASTVDQGIEILTGLHAGEPDSRGRYPAGTINRRVTDKPARMSRRAAAAGLTRSKYKNTEALCWRPQPALTQLAMWLRATSTKLRGTRVGPCASHKWSGPAGHAYRCQEADRQALRGQKALSLWHDDGIRLNGRGRKGTICGQQREPPAGRCR